MQPVRTAILAAVLAISSSFADEIGTPEPTCAIEMRFLDSAGKTLAVKHRVLLRPSTAASLDFPGTHTLTWRKANGAKAQVRAQINVVERSACNSAETPGHLVTGNGKANAVLVSR